MTTHAMNVEAEVAKVISSFPTILPEAEKHVLCVLSQYPEQQAIEGLGGYTNVLMNKLHIALKIITNIIIKEAASSGLPFAWPVSPQYDKNGFVKENSDDRPEHSMFSPYLFLFCKWWRDLPPYIGADEITSLNANINVFFDRIKLLYNDTNKMLNQYRNIVRYINWQKQRGQDIALTNAYVIKEFVDYYAEYLKSQRAHRNARTGRQQVSPALSSLGSRAIFQVMQPIMQHQGYIANGESLIGSLPCRTGMMLIRQAANVRAQEDHVGSTNCALDTATLTLDDEELYIRRLWGGELKTRTEVDHLRILGMFTTHSRWGSRGQNLRDAGLNSLTTHMHPNQETPKECMVISSVQRIGKTCNATGSTRVKEVTFHTIHTSDIRYDAMVNWGNYLIHHCDYGSMFKNMLRLLKAQFEEMETHAQPTTVEHAWKHQTPIFPSTSSKNLYIQSGQHSNDFKALFELNDENLHTKITHICRYFALFMLMACSANQDAAANILKFQHANTMNSVYAKGALNGTELFKLSHWVSEKEYAPWWFKGTLEKHDVPQKLWDAVAPEFDSILKIAKKTFKKYKNDNSAVKAAKALKLFKITFFEASVWLRPEFPDRVIYKHKIFADPELRTEWNNFAIRHMISCLAEKYKLVDTYPKIHIREWPTPISGIDEDRMHPIHRIRQEKRLQEEKKIDVFSKVKKVCDTCGIGMDAFIRITEEMGHKDILKRFMPSVLPTNAVASTSASNAQCQTQILLEPFPINPASVRELWDMWVFKYKKMYEVVERVDKTIPWSKLGDNTGSIRNDYNRYIEFFRYTEKELNVFKTRLPMEARADKYFAILEDFRKQASNVSVKSWIQQDFYFMVRKCNDFEYEQMKKRGCTPEDLRKMFDDAGLTVPEMRKTRGGGRPSKRVKFADDNLDVGMT